MKKILITSMLLFFVILSVRSQEVKEYGPKAGNFGVGISANPAFEYIGNFFGKTEKNSAPTADLANGYNLFGKYFLSNKGAVRVGINLAYKMETSHFGVDDLDELISSESAFGLALGYERRVGSGRIQAFFGPSMGFGLSSATDEYTLDDANKGDLLKEKYGSSFSFAVGGFGGVEYFITNNIAIGTELGLGLNISSVGKGLNEYKSSKDVETGSESSIIRVGFNNTPAQLAPRGTVYISIYF
jgi:hypothetical protein